MLFGVKFKYMVEGDIFIFLDANFVALWIYILIFMHFISYVSNNIKHYGLLCCYWYREDLNQELGC